MFYFWNFDIPTNLAVRSISGTSLVCILFLEPQWPYRRRQHPLKPSTRGKHSHIQRLRHCSETRTARSRPDHNQLGRKDSHTPERGDRVGADSKQKSRFRRAKEMVRNVRDFSGICQGCFKHLFVGRMQATAPLLTCTQTQNACMSTRARLAQRSQGREWST